MSNLLLSKLRPPVLPPRQVQRPELAEWLNEGLRAGRPLTLVSAPAGFGKTTSVSQWASTLDCPVSWLSLDPADDDPVRFFSYLLAALQQVEERIGREILALLRAGQLPPPDVIGTTLCNDLLKVGDKFVLIVDDFQRVQEPLILEVWQQIVANLPPALHLVLLTREDPGLPLARLRANNQMTELRAADLRFSAEDVDSFLNGALELSLSPADVTALANKTEGWIAGLQLAALSLRNRANPSEFIAGLSGSHRHILSYLTEEVLSRQPEEIQKFLLQTSILERVTGDLGDAVTGRQDSHFLLEKLVNGNLFLLPLDDEQRWYRYHHLFADLLRARQQLLRGEETAILHRRASGWYARADMPAEAIQHALAGQDYETAVFLIEKHATSMIMLWYVKTVQGWMQALPPEWSARSPKTNLAFAWTHLLHGDFTQAAPYLERLEEIFAQPPAALNPALRSEWLALQAMLHNARRNPQQGLDLGRQALDLVPAAESNVRGLISLALAGSYQQMAADEQTMEAYRQMIHYGWQADNLVTELLGVSGLALLALQQGQLHLAFATASRGAERIAQSGTIPPIGSAVYGELGEVHYQWHQLEQADAYFRRAIEVSTLSGYRDAEIYHAVVRSRLSQIEGDMEAAATAMRQAVKPMQDARQVAVRAEVVAQEVHVYLAQHNLAAAEAVLQQNRVSWPGSGLAPGEEEQAISSQQGLLCNSTLRVWLYRARKCRETAVLERGIVEAGRLLAALLKRRYLPLALETLLLRAQMYDLLGETSTSLADIARALELGAPEGFITPFVIEGQPAAAALAQLLAANQLGDVPVDYVQKILAAFPEDARRGSGPVHASAVPPLSEALLEPLTRRELEILQLIQGGYSNEEVATRLSISLHTVKKHCSNVYSKLQVSSRTQAVARASQLGLLQ